MYTIRVTEYEQGLRKRLNYSKKGSELTGYDLRRMREHQREVRRMTTAGVVGVGVMGLIGWGASILIGTPGENISEENGVLALQNAAAKKYNSKSLREKFEMTYIGGFTVKVRSIEGGSGVGGKRDPYAATFGQKCLSPTPFNTKPSEIKGKSGGTILPPASFHIDSQTGEALVTPYGGNSDNSLRFSVQNGELIPTVATIATLAANKCVIIDGIPASTPHDKNGLVNTEVIDISSQIAPLHPGRYQS